MLGGVMEHNTRQIISPTSILEIASAYLLGVILLGPFVYINRICMKLTTIGLTSKHQNQPRAKSPQNTSPQEQANAGPTNTFTI